MQCVSKIPLVRVLNNVFKCQLDLLVQVRLRSVSARARRTAMAILLLGSNRTLDLAPIRPESYRITKIR